MDAKARIKELMTQRGWSIYRLSQESGIAMSTLTNLFRRGQQPTYECQLESEPRARLILSHLCSFEKCKLH